MLFRISLHHRSPPGKYTRILQSTDPVARNGLQTWIVPEETKDILKKLKRKSMRKAGSRKTYIFKPDAASQGDGISLLQKPEDLKRLVEGLGLGCDAVVQEYVDKPLLLDNSKFDLRLYVLVLGSGCSPRVFVCREGLARVCVQEYEAPAPKNLHKVGTHLTNYSINSKDAGFDRSADGNKRLMSTVLAKLAEEGSINAEALWKQMLESIAITVQAMAENATGSAEESSEESDSGNDEDSGSDGSGAEPSKKFFHVLGFDLILDGDGWPVLLEVNARPSLKIDSVYPLEQPSVAELRARAEERRRRAELKDRFANADKLQFLPGQDTPGPGSYQIDRYLKHAGGNGRAEKGSMDKTRTTGPDSRPQQSPQCPPKLTSKAEVAVCNGKGKGVTDSKEPLKRMDSGEFGPWSRCNSGKSDAEAIMIECDDKTVSPCGSDQHDVDADDAGLHGPVTPSADEVPVAEEHSAACLFCSEDGKYSLTPEAEEAWNKVYLKGSVRPTWFEMQASAPGKTEGSFRQDLEVPPPAAPTKLKVCKCMSHYKPHLHIPSIVDLTAKGQAILGALDIVKNWLSKADFELDNLTEGTAYEEVVLQS
ncbi:hypothetical protein CYMTET_12679 [Cymbomonas tetramitiformis]|uniref:Uncharacterized protein n=1 Tax=Cymbomonas tetramitiformis TaxID=36881 RepID=A0AAE0LC69_9CHLO|nr:hypothetical protein CYMTET_12679 [Cymbomonas tetramitiformis]